MTFFRILNIVTLTFGIVICITGLVNHISFGWGLGDILWYPFLYGWTIFQSYITIKKRTKRKRTLIWTSLFAILFFSFISLMATVWRGQEYPWNGKIFYEGNKDEVTIGY
jgi:hypothetical protein